ncbi:MAG: DUF2071 domain-containing protein [Polyangiaceae bacterium]|nr:DUF2071 domain-containing protein [Polyangiaceae bacterium]
MAEIDRIAPTRRPDAAPTGEQRWRQLFFLHWIYDAEEVAPLVPKGMSLDLWEGRAYVGLVPFLMEGIRPAWLPRAFAMDFLETNLRTYVIVNGEPGVLFFSLEASSLLAVKAARYGWGLPYYFAKMSSSREGDRVRYESARRGAHADLRLDASIGEALGPSAPGTLEHFLLERYLLFTSWRDRIYRGQVHHAAYPAQRATVHHVESTLLEAAGLPPGRGEPLAHYASGVDVDVFGPHAQR